VILFGLLGTLVPALIVAAAASSGGTVATTLTFMTLWAIGLAAVVITFYVREPLHLVLKTADAIGRPSREFQEGVEKIDAGKVEEALSAFEQAAAGAADSGRRGDALFNVAVCHVRLGSRAAAMAAAREAMAANPALSADFKSDPDFAPLMADAAFRRLLTPESTGGDPRS